MCAKIWEIFGRLKFMFDRLPPEEIERRRKLSVEAYKNVQASEFDKWYQEKCDTLYWRNGPCCAGCDHWQSEGGLTGDRIP